MSKSFFLDWELWQQMSFVLACAIVLVFCLGWAKLWWIGRRNKKHEVVDEEKRVKIQQLRLSGQPVRSGRDNQVPFGIRALESGLEIDGIWVSTSQTPISESLKQLRSSDQSSDSSIMSNDKRIASLELSPRTVSFSEALEPVFRHSRHSFEPMTSHDYLSPPSLKSFPGARAGAYKPRRSSQLRFSSYGDIQVNKDALCQLEGATPSPPPDEACHERDLCAPSAVEGSASDTDAEAERPSSTHLDGSLTCKQNIGEDSPWARLSSSKPLSRRKDGANGHYSPVSPGPNESNELPSSGGYFRVPLDSPPRPKANPFASPDVSPSLVPVPMRLTNRLPMDEVEALGETQWPLLSKRQPEINEMPLFVPGALHANKTVRKINSGFELLPAGSFDAPSSTGEKNSRRMTSLMASGEEGGKRRSNRLQKRVRP